MTVVAAAEVETHHGLLADLGGLVASSWVPPDRVQVVHDLAKHTLATHAPVGATCQPCHSAWPCRVYRMALDLIDVPFPTKEDA